MRLQIRFVRGSGLDSKFIEWGTRAWVSHVEILHGMKTFGAQLQGGVRWRDIKDPCYKDVTRTEVWSVDITDEQEAHLWAITMATACLPYDWRAIAAFAFGERDWRADDSWFCSEWVSMVLEKLGLVAFPAKLPFDRITPRDIYLIFTRLPGARWYGDVR